jgi:hypothetical protein
MAQITVAQLKDDIAGKMKGTSIREVKDFYGTAASAAARMLARIDTDETRRTQTLSTPFWDNIQDYVAPTDYKRMIDIRPQVAATWPQDPSHFSQTGPRQFRERLDANSFSIQWNNGVRTLRAQRLPAGNVSTLDTFDSATSNGTWTAAGDASGLYIEPLNYIQGNGALGFNLSGSTGAANLVNSTATAVDLSALLYKDSSFLYVFIPLGSSARFTSFKLRRGSSASAYKEATATAKGDGTAFTDGWNFLRFDWNTATTTGIPDDTQNTYRYFGIAYSAGAVITGFLVDSWTDALGSLYEAEYYSEDLFRTSAGVWEAAPTDDSDILNVSYASYEIFKTEMMVDIVQQIRIEPVRSTELADFRLQLNGQPQSRYVKDPPYHGLYQDYLKANPSSAIVTTSSYFDYDI